MKESFLWLKKAAENGHPVAQYDFAVALGEEDNVHKNPMESLSWYGRSAMQGYYGAQYNLGVFYDQGEGVKKNRVEALKWFLLAARQGYPLATKPIFDLENQYVDPVKEVKKFLNPDEIRRAIILADEIEKKAWSQKSD